MNDVNGCYGVSHCNPTAEAYKILVNIFNKKDATHKDLTISIEQAIGFLGAALRTATDAE